MEVVRERSSSLSDGCGALGRRGGARSGGSRAFVYAVSTTGIYCRPGCPSRLPNRDNVTFFDAWQAAEAAGFRPCKRCTPQMPAASDAALQAVIEACRAIEQAERAPTLRELADAAGYSPTHFQRLFKERVGVSPKQYAMETRTRRVREGLRAGRRSRTRSMARALGRRVPSTRPLHWG